MHAGLSEIIGKFHTVILLGLTLTPSNATNYFA